MQYTPLLAKYHSISRGRRIMWLCLSLGLGLFSGGIQTAYHIQDFRTQLAFSCDVPFTLALNGQPLELTYNQVVQKTDERPYVGVMEDISLDLTKDILILSPEEDPRSLELITYRNQWPDPYKMMFWSFYRYLPFSMKKKLNLSRFPPSLILSNITGQVLLPLENPLVLTPQHLGFTSNYDSLSLFFAWVQYALYHSLIFALTTLPVLFCRRPTIKKKGNPLLFTLLGLLGVVWGYHSFFMAKKGGLFSQTPLWISLPYLLLLLAGGWLVYGGIIALLLSFARRHALLRVLAVGGVLSLLLILVIQTGFLAFWDNHLSFIFFDMIEGEVLLSMIGLTPILLALALALACLWGGVVYPSSPFPYRSLAFFPFLACAFYTLSFTSHLTLHHHKMNIYNVTGPVGRLAFHPLIQPVVGLLREYVKYIKRQHKQGSLNLVPLTPQKEAQSRTRGLALGEQPSSYPAGERPFKRVILIALEGYRLHYIPEFNPLLKGLVKSFPFFNRPEVQTVRLPHYYASSLPTTNSLIILLTSHLNYSAIRYSQNLNQYPSLPRLLVDHGFQTTYICPVDIAFDSYDQLLPNMGFKQLTDFDAFSHIEDEDYRKSGILSPNQWGFPSRFLYQEIKGHLKKAGDSPVFILAINTDTHSPAVGMAMSTPSNYGNLSYPNDGVRNPTLSKDITNTLISTFRAAVDLDQFYQDLHSEGLWDEDTLLVVTADHSQPSLEDTLFPSPSERTFFDPLPLIILSGRPLPPLPSHVYASHLDLAPTLLDLMGIAKPPSFWGESLYRNPTEHKAWFNLDEGILYSQDAKGIQEWPLLLHPDLGELYHTFFVKTSSSKEENN